MPKWISHFLGLTLILTSPSAWSSIESLEDEIFLLVPTEVRYQDKYYNNEIMFDGCMMEIKYFAKGKSLSGNRWRRWSYSDYPQNIAKSELSIDATDDFYGFMLRIKLAENSVSMERERELDDWERKVKRSKYENIKLHFGNDSQAGKLTYLKMKKLKKACQK
ncbi:hypothetical protein ACMXYW_03830 [Neptuniibacter sp. QD48_55]|uniref:hypothetical protein n=1 Tax=Neptuniibacter sp. QD48_55 TaxID=3398212 RepID=UPI0039F4E510